MKKQVYGRKLKRDVNERKALFKNLLTSLVLQERIKTTEAKAKAIRSAADKLITKAKKAHSGHSAELSRSPGSGQGGENVYKSLHPDINQQAVVKVIAEIAPRFAKRQGGYTRIIKIGKRRVADNAHMVYMEWTEQGSKVDAPLSAKSPKKAKKSMKDTKKTKTEAEKAPKVEVVKPVMNKKEEKAQKTGFFKKLITRQKKGQ